MEKQFVLYAVAKILKEKGFDEECFGYFDNKDHMLHYAFGIATFKSMTKETQAKQVLAPTYQQVIEWFRTKHKILISIDYMIYPLIRYVIVSFENDKPVVKYKACYTLNYHQNALDYVIDDALEMI